MKVHLNKLELHGFKSFPEKTVIKFHPGITTIIGPNGCGKSNIVDALLWVLGEQRIKNLRGENNEDLIFGGSVSKKPLGMTEVGAYFSGEGEDTYIARRFYRTGEGKYILNEKYCRNRDIQDQLYKLNMGGRNYFIFEQGSIEKLVSLKPSERRLLIEEAAGISQYLVRKKETANKLLIAQQNLDNLEILTFDKEKRLKELKNQANYVSRYRNIKSQSLEYIKAYLTKKYSALKVLFDEKKKSVEKKLGEEMVLLKDISDTEKRYSDLETEKWDLDQALKKHQKELYDLNRKLIADKGEIEKLRQESTFLVSQKRENTELISSGNEELKALRSLHDRREKEFDSMEKEYKEAELEYNKASEKKSVLREETENLEEEIKKTTRVLFDIRSKISLMESEIYESEKRAFKIENEMESEKESIRSMKSEIDENAILSEEKNLTFVEKELREAEQNFREIEESLKNSKKLHEDTMLEIKEMKSQLDMLTKQKERYLQMKNKLSLKKSGSDTDKFRLLQDLIRAEKKDNKLIENFYFDEFNALIPADIKDILASDRDRFYIPGEKKERIDDAISREKGFVCFVKDLFNTDEPSLKESLKEGVVVKTLESGLNMFLKFGIPVVTLDSEVITSSGVVFKNRSLGILDLLDEIKAIDEKSLTLKELLEKKENIVKDLYNNLKQKESDLSQAAEKKEDLGKKLFQTRLTLKNLVNIRDSRTRKIENLKNAGTERAERLNRIKEKIKDLKNKKDELTKKIDTLEREKTQFQKNRENKLKENAEKEKEFWKTENRLNLIKEKRSGLINERKRVENEIDKISSTIKKHKDEIVEFEKRAAEIDRLIKELSGGRDKGSERVDELEKEIKEKETALTKVNENIKKLSEKLSSQRTGLNELKEKKSSFEIELASVKKDIFSLEEVSFKELNRELGKVEADEELVKLEVEELEKNADALKERLVKMRDSNRLNFSAESEYELLEKDYGMLVSQKEDVVESIQNMTEAINKIDEESKESFMEAFKIVNENFKKNFQILFEGGDAELSLIDDSNILETGLEIMAQPPGKRLQSLRLLSGGEKTLTSLAFLFALFEYKPSPFCVFDEVDASLDEANIQRFLKFLHKLKEKTQFLIITHNFKTMEEADYIYGISMNEPGISTIYSMKMNSHNGFPGMK